ncbi:FtsH protease regulator HflC [compost metagenome]
MIIVPLERVFEAIDSLGPFWSTVIYAILIVGTAFLAIIKTFKLVEHGNQAIRLNRGRVVCDKNGDAIILGPGLKMMIPFWQTIKVVSTLDRTIDLETIPVKGKEKFEAYNVRSTLTTSIKNIFYWLYGAEEIDDRVRSIAQELIVLHFGRLVRDAANDVEVRALELFDGERRQVFLKELTKKLEENKLGGTAKDINITLFMPAYEGWTPQALSGIGSAIHHQSNGSDLSLLKVMMNGIWKLFTK